VVKVKRSTDDIPPAASADNIPYVLVIPEANATRARIFPVLQHDGRLPIEHRLPLSKAVALTAETALTHEAAGFPVKLEDVVLARLLAEHEREREVRRRQKRFWQASLPYIIGPMVGTLVDGLLGALLGGGGGGGGGSQYAEQPEPQYVGGGVTISVYYVQEGDIYAGGY
jgi:hypothetical protein